MYKCLIGYKNVLNFPLQIVLCTKISTLFLERSEMNKLVLILLCLVLSVNCSRGPVGKGEKKKLTTRHRDSVLSKSKLPGAKVVGKAISISDTTRARSKRMDDLSK